jgi:hypothetical protein
MWSSDDITIAIEEVDHPTVLVSITTPVGVVELLAEASVIDRTLYIKRAHIGGLASNALGRRGLNAIGRKLLEVADVAAIIIQGSARASGPGKGRIPRPIKFPNRI